VCSPSQGNFIITPPYFISFYPNQGQYFFTFNSQSPDNIYQYIVQAPIVQVTTTTTSITTSSTSLTPQSYTASSTQASSSVSSTTTQQTTTTTSSTTVTNITQQIVTALANPIVALILALALVGLALFIFV